MRFVPKLLLSLVFAGASLTASAASYSSMVVFGDSLSDPGNALFLTKDIPFPGAGTLFLTSQGQNVDALGHFSNGPTAPEYMATALGLTTALGWGAPPGGAGSATNFAVGGALTGPDVINGQQHLSNGAVPVLAVTGVMSQVNMFVTSGLPFNPASTLFVIQGGGNDIFKATTYAQANALSPAATNALYGAVVDNATNNLAGSITTLALSGAKNILWESLPDLGLTPESQAGGPAVQAGASGLTDFFNFVLGLKIAGVSGGLAGNGFDVNIFGFDTAGFMRTYAANPGAALSMTATNCVAATDLPDCAGRFFFDTVHPTTAAHQLFANGLLAAAVPEPELWMLMLVGVGVVGLRARRRA